MFFTHTRTSILTLTLILLLIISACTAVNPTTKDGPTEVPVLRIAALTILDAFPMHVAQQQGLFEKHGVKVELIPVGSAPERDQLIASGQADGMINEALSSMIYNQDQVQVQIVRFARAATSDTPLFSILAAGNSGITDLDGLKGVPIGISEGTIIEYLTDRLLEAEGFTSSDIGSVAVPKISDRMALLGSGELKAAMLPEPLSFLARQQGAKLIIDDTTHPQYSYSTITFRKPVIDQNPQAVKAFLAALEEATVEINKDPNKWKQLLVDLNLLPPPLVESYQVPTFTATGIPSESQWFDVLAWAKENGLTEKDVPYQDSVNGSLLP